MAYLGGCWQCCEWPPGLPKQFLPHLDELEPNTTSCQMYIKSQDPRINKANKICLPAACQASGERSIPGTNDLIILSQLLGLCLLSGWVCDLPYGSVDLKLILYVHPSAKQVE